MKRILSAAALLSFLAAVGCAPALNQPQDASDAASVAAAKAASNDSKSAKSDKATADAEAAIIDAEWNAIADAADAAASDADASAKAADSKAETAPWGAGDFVIYRFSGSFHKTPITLTEKVIARTGDTFTLDVTYDDGKSKEAIRARMKGDSPMRAEVVSVARLVGGAEQPAKAALFDEILARVALSADSNEATLGTETVKVDVAGHGTLACERTTYRVKVGKQTATMRTLATAGFVWGDIGAEITAESGKVIYKAEVIDAGHDAAKAPAVASADDEY